MNQNWIAAAIAFGLLFPVTPATAWWHWYYQDIPYLPVPGMWFYQNLPQAPAFGQSQPRLWNFQAVPSGSTSMWASTFPMSTLFVEQSQSQAGYSIRVYTGQPGTQDIEIGLEGRALFIRRSEHSRAFPGARLPIQQSEWTTQWVSLPADANLGALRMSRGSGLIEIFVPRAWR